MRLGIVGVGVLVPATNLAPGLAFEPLVVPSKGIRIGESGRVDVWELSDDCAD